MNKKFGNLLWPVVILKKTLSHFISKLLYIFQAFVAIQFHSGINLTKHLLSTSMYQKTMLGAALIK